MLTYVSAKKKILKYIKSENLLAGDRLPTEKELSEQLDISRLTLREALTALKNEGIVYAVQGRGTFVACDYNHISDTLNINYGVTEMIEMAGYKPGVQSFEKKLIKADEQIAQQLNVQPGSDVLMCSRIRTADGTPVVYSEDYITPQLTPQFLGVIDENISLYRFFEEECGLTLGTSMTELIPTVADKHLSGMMEIPLYSPLLELRARVVSTFGETLTYAIEYLRPDKFKFIVSRGR